MPACVCVQMQLVVTEFMLKMRLPFSTLRFMAVGERDKLVGFRWPPFKE